MAKLFIKKMDVDYILSAIGNFKERTGLMPTELVVTSKVFEKMIAHMNKISPTWTKHRLLHNNFTYFGILVKPVKGKLAEKLYG